MSFSRIIRSTTAFTFIDLFAGIGGLRKGFDAHGGKCVFTSEWNRFSRMTYRENFPDDAHEINGDITKVSAAAIPDCDVLLAGFPCQPFSIAGVSKKNSMGMEHGFQDKTQGTLFFDVARIIDAKCPRAFVLENVKNLMSHDKGKTFKVIMDTLKNDLGYHVSVAVIDAKRFLPQHRERVFLVGFRENRGFSFGGMRFPDAVGNVGSILHTPDEAPDGRFITSDGVHPRYGMSQRLFASLQGHAEKHRAAGHGFGFGLVTAESPSTRTLSARYHKDGSEILLERPGQTPRRLTPRECARLMGYPDSFAIPAALSDTQAYRQFGNSVAIPVVTEIARLVAERLKASEAGLKAA